MMWVSSGGTMSVLHNDYAENINCVFKGAKTFYLVDRKHMDVVSIQKLLETYFCTLIEIETFCSGLPVESRHRKPQRNN